MKAILAGFGSSQLLSRDFPHCNQNDHTVKDILGKNIIQFGYVLSELMSNCHDSEESEEVWILIYVRELSAVKLRTEWL